MHQIQRFLKFCTIISFTLWVITTFMLTTLFEFHPQYTQLNLKKTSFTLPLTKIENEGLLPSNLLKGPLSFIGKGNQSFVFETQDQQYVIKVFNFSHLKPYPWEPLISPKKYRTKLRKLKRIFNSHSLAYSQDKIHTGLLYLHLKPSTDLPAVSVRDRWGFKHAIDLNQAYFVIQKKGKTTRQVIGDFLQANRLPEAKKHFELLLNMYLDEYALGLWDHDHNLMHNTGFYEETPLRMDIGKLELNQEICSHYKDDLHKIIHIRIARWLKKYHPAYQQEIVNELNQKYLSH